MIEKYKKTNKIKYNNEIKIENIINIKNLCIGAFIHLRNQREFNLEMHNI